jgi:glucose/arabinose dehydrogenase
MLPGNPAISLVKVAEGLADPVSVAAAPDGSGRLFVVERVGRIRIVQNGELLEAPFLDLRDLVRYDHLEQGLLGLAFHPNYAENGRFYIYYTDWLTNGDSFLVEYHVSDDPNQADPASARVLLTHDQPYINHAGGTLHFGPDGSLYLAMGDGGLAGDPYRNAQDLSNLLGKLLRIDVEVDGGRPYRIPADNPFLGQVLASPAAQQAAQNGSYWPAARPEIWAYGLSNPWQFSFDPATGDLYIPDRGQNSWEEINFQPAGSAGGWNYGWPLLEASHCYLAANACGQSGVPPVAEYEHSQGNCEITGIGVYRGQAFPRLNGIYFSADRCSGTFWGLTRTESGAWAFAELGGTDLQVIGAGTDEAGELYVTACTCEDKRGYNPQANPGGSVWRLVAVE